MSPESKVSTFGRTAVRAAKSSMRTVSWRDAGTPPETFFSDISSSSGLSASALSGTPTMLKVPCGLSAAR